VRLTREGAESRIDKCARPVRARDHLVFAVGGRLTAVEILALGERRGPPAEARTLYRALEAPATPDTGLA
jgi:ribosomal 50S subunit-recycling heat shock protein